MYTSDKFQEEQTVIVCFTRKDLYDFQESPRMKCTIKRCPSDTGDNWIFEHSYYTGKFRDTLKWVTFTVNPNCSDFVGLESVDR